MNGLRKFRGELLWLARAEVPDTDVKIRAVGDVNGDQWPDLVWQNQATGPLSAWLMNDRQRLSEVLLSPDHVADTNWRIVGIRSQELLRSLHVDYYRALLLARVP